MEPLHIEALWPLTAHVKKTVSNEIHMFGSGGFLLLTCLLCSFSLDALSRQWSALFMIILLPPDLDDRIQQKVR